MTSKPSSTPWSWIKIYKEKIINSNDERKCVNMSPTKRTKYVIGGKSRSLFLRSNNPNKIFVISVFTEVKVLVPAVINSWHVLYHLSFYTYGPKTETQVCKLLNESVELNGGMYAGGYIYIQTKTLSLNFYKIKKWQSCRYIQWVLPALLLVCSVM